MIAKAIVTWITSGIALMLCGELFAGVQVTSFGFALLAGLVVGLANALIWPTLIRVTLPLTVLTLGVFALILNGALILLVAAISPGLEVDSLGAGVLCTLMITAVTSLVSGLMFIDDDARAARHFVRRSSRKASGGAIETD